MSFSCPLCHQPLSREKNSYICPQRHQFDMAKEGYVNLLPVQHKRSRDPGDSAEMMQARRAFLDAGHYQPLRDAIVAQLQERLDEKATHKQNCTSFNPKSVITYNVNYGKPFLNMSRSDAQISIRLPLFLHTYATEYAPIYHCA